MEPRQAEWEQCEICRPVRKYRFLIYPPPPPLRTPPGGYQLLRLLRPAGNPSSMPPAHSGGPRQPRRAPSGIAPAAPWRLFHRDRAAQYQDRSAGRGDGSGHRARADCVTRTVSARADGVVFIQAGAGQAFTWRAAPSPIRPVSNHLPAGPAKVNPARHCEKMAGFHAWNAGLRLLFRRNFHAGAGAVLRKRRRKSRVFDTLFAK